MNGVEQLEFSLDHYLRGTMVTADVHSNLRHRDVVFLLMVND
jgi:hypothetical protein